jgi:regulator of protease activity HflC (stomatin/prohibitin superfamily)
MTQNKTLAKNWKPIVFTCGGCLLIIIVLSMLAIFLTTLVHVNPEERGVIAVSPYEPEGYRGETLKLGYHWIWPGEQVIIYPISSQTYTMSSTGQKPDSIRVLTVNGWTIDLDVAVTYRLDETKLRAIDNNWKDRYEADLVRPYTRYTLCGVIPQFSADEIIKTRRKDIEQVISKQLEKKLAEHGLVLIKFAILDARVPLLDSD